MEGFLLAQTAGRAAIREKAQVIDLSGGLSDELLQKMWDRFGDFMTLGNIRDRRALLGEFLKRIEISRKKERTQTRQLMMRARVTPLMVVTPRGFEPLFSA